MRLKEAYFLLGVLYNAALAQQVDMSKKIVEWRVSQITQIIKSLFRITNQHMLHE
jgi:hypothetical protein